MRAGASLTFRDIGAARQSWQRAKRVADRLPADDLGRDAMRIAPRTLLCASPFRVTRTVDDTGYDELCPVDPPLLMTKCRWPPPRLGQAGDTHLRNAVSGGDRNWPRSSRISSMPIDDPVLAVMHLPIGGHGEDHER